jgi:hypothetical protein
MTAQVASTNLEDLLKTLNPGDEAVLLQNDLAVAKIVKFEEIDPTNLSKQRALENGTKAVKIQCGSLQLTTYLGPKPLTDEHSHASLAESYFER